MQRPTWAPGEIDLGRPSAARVYDYYLGGAHNFAVDRELARQAMHAMPELPEVMQANRAFLRRAVRFLVRAGVRQFLDLGSGIPTVGNVHEVAQRVDPECRVVYVDIDSVAVSHGQVILAENERATAIQADMREPEEVLTRPEVRSLLDLSQPIGVLMVAVLHFVSDTDGPASILARYRKHIVPGSYLVVSHATHEHKGEHGAMVEQLYERTTSPLHPRNRQQVVDLVSTGFELVDPGVVYLPLWRPDSPEDVGEHPERTTTYAAVGQRL